MNMNDFKDSMFFDDSDDSVPVEALVPVTAEALEARVRAEREARKAGKRPKIANATPAVPLIDLTVPDVVQLDRAVIASALKANSIAVMSVRDGVGKTTVAGMLALTLASFRSERLLVADGDGVNADLASAFGFDPKPQIQQAVADMADMTKHDLVDHTTEVNAGVDLMACVPDTDVDPANATALMRLLRRSYDMVIADVGGASDSVGHALLTGSHLPVIVTGPNREGIRSAEIALEWLDAVGHDSHKAIVVINGVPRKRGAESVSQMVRYFNERAGGCAVLPLDQALLDSEQTLTRKVVSAETTAAYTRLADVCVRALLAKATKSSSIHGETHEWTVDLSDGAFASAPTLTAVAAGDDRAPQGE